MPIEIHWSIEIVWSLRERISTLFLVSSGLYFFSYLFALIWSFLSLGLALVATLDCLCIATLFIQSVPIRLIWKAAFSFCFTPPWLRPFHSFGILQRKNTDTARRLYSQKKGNRSRLGFYFSARFQDVGTTIVRYSASSSSDTWHYKPLMAKHWQRVYIYAD